MPTPIAEYKRIIASTEHAKGINTATSKIVSEIFGATEEISIEDLAKITGYSLATISNAVKFLEQHGIIKKVKKPGSKKVYVKTERDFMTVLIKNMNKNHETAIRPLKQILPELVKEQKQLIKENKQETKKEQLKKELHIIQQHLEQVEQMERIFDHVITQCNKNRKSL